MSLLSDCVLSEQQNYIINECLKKKKACISMNMGDGKTLTSLETIIRIQKSLGDNCPPALIVAGKTLITTFTDEIKKFYAPDSLKYETIVTKIDKNYVPKPDTKIIITTPSMLAKCYTECHIDQMFVGKEFVNVSAYTNLKTEKIIYGRPTRPYLEYAAKKGLDYFYGTKFSVLIVDEIQKYTKITTMRAQALAAVCSDYRFMLSGTVFDEPTIDRILGYYLILGHDFFPRNIPDAQEFVKRHTFKGTSETCIEFQNEHTNDSSETKLGITINKYVIEHELTYEEQLIYVSMKNVLKILQDYIKRSKNKNDSDSVRKFNSYILTMITYIRQSIVCPLVPLAGVALNILDIHNKSDLSVILNDQLKKLNLNEWLDDESSIISTRIKKVVEVVEKHKNEKIVLFTCFKTSLDTIEYIIENTKSLEGIKIFKINSQMNVTKRDAVIKNFMSYDIKEGPCIFLLTYELGAEGLNLQCASTLLIVDFWWNVGKTNQAMSRIVRQGQKANVSIYFFTSNTGIEKSLFEKQQDKLLIIDEIKNGPMKSSIGTIKMNEILKLIEKNENINLLNKLHLKK